MPGPYVCDSSQNGLFYWDANVAGVDAHGGNVVATHPDGTYDVNFESQDGREGQPRGSSATFTAPDYVDPGCVVLSSGVSVPAASAPPRVFAPPNPQVVSTDPIIIENEGETGVPFTYQLSDVQRLEPMSVTALWDGTTASGSFKPCLSFYAPDGTLLGRTFPDQDLAVGDTAEVTYAPF